MLRAIAIYDDSDRSTSNKFQRIDSAQQEKNTNSFFTRIDQLEDLEKYTLPSLPTNLDTTRPYSIAIKAEYHYVKKEPDSPYVMAICSRNKLDPLEVAHLFANIKHTQVRPDRIKYKLSDIIANPIGYTRCDLYIGEIKESVTVVKELAIDLIDKVLARQEQLEELNKKTVDLAEQSSQFQKKSKALNSRCCGMA